MKPPDSSLTLKGDWPMRRRVLLITLGVLFALVVVPVLFTQLTRQRPAPRPPVDPDKLSYEEVRFENPAAGIDLAGMLFVPEGEPPFPAVVIIHGAGASRRANPWYLTYAGHLQGKGIAVLLPDKRGCESSGGDWRSSSLQDLATDTSPPSPISGRSTPSLSSPSASWASVREASSLPSSPPEPRAYPSSSTWWEARSR